MNRFSNILSTAVVCLVGVTVAVCMLGTESRDTSHGPRDAVSQSIAIESSAEPVEITSNHPIAAAESRATSDQDSAAAAAHGVIIRKPDGPPLVELTAVDPQGRSGQVACSTCHSVRPANHENRTAETLDEFHQGFSFKHGNITCYSCHNPDGSDTLRMADGTSVQYQDVMTLCSQCHSAQAMAYKHGAHGGMNGFWDLSRGPQKKNNCVDCHDPHMPEYPKMIVGFKPRDRFLKAESHDDDH